MENQRTLLRLGENAVVVKTDTPTEDGPRLYVAASMSDQIGASLNVAAVKLLHDTLGEWLVEIRDPDAGVWEERADGSLTFTRYGARPVEYQPPEREGYEPSWVNVVGNSYTQWIYRPTKEA